MSAVHVIEILKAKWEGGGGLKAVAPCHSAAKLAALLPSVASPHCKEKTQSSNQKTVAA